MQEIERKFLVNNLIHEVLKAHQPLAICQGYIYDGADGKTVRVRTKGNKGYLTIKGKSTGISRTEFEYEIPYADAVILLEKFCEKTLIKDRYNIEVGGMTWDVDQFHGQLEGLIVAEIELEDEAQSFEHPEWLAQEVSDDARYYNVNLINGSLSL
jgi:CYTH domain-containing protein